MDSEGRDYEYGFYFSEKKRYTWNYGNDPEIGDCYFFDLDVRLIKYEGDLFRVEWENINGELEEYIIEIQINNSGNRIIIDGLVSGIITINKMEVTLNEFEPKCDFDFNEIPDPE